MGSQEKLLDQIFQLRFTSKSLVRQAKKCDKEEKAERMKVKRAIEKGNMDGARIYAQNAIRKRTEQLNYLRLGSRLDAVVSRLDTQAKMNTISKSMAGIVKSLDRAMAVNNLEQVSETMDQFEKQFTDLDVRQSFIEGAMHGSTSMSTPEDQVTALMQEVADQHQLELSTELLPTTNKPITVAAAEDEANDLSQRLEKLKGQLRSS
ncbi:hypothetical protein CBR_g789 [Chara braunii]|uniref:Uncharacterized protein n=1 Tax=Chara braunii TaxID=69332 RepID=A0A388KCA3_CHABU|nr:hypothetical protein CBR_g789 [Chara braunii]|eukprot:GBG67661.1 hypothetical protein CBR_g789 [Chara braunii]